MKKILFVGDSITDASRSKTPERQDFYIGSGYPFVVSSYLSYEYVGEYRVLNRGISGNRIVDLYARFRNDCIQLAPDYVSILIGVNDVWHGIDWDNGVDTDRYETILELMIEDIKRYLPNTKVIIMEPFVLRGTKTEATEDRWNQFKEGVAEKAAAARRVASKYSVPFVELQKLLEEKAATVEYGAVLEDGVHPTAYGHTIIGKEWIKAFEAAFISCQ